MSLLTPPFETKTEVFRFANEAFDEPVSTSKENVRVIALYRVKGECWSKKLAMKTPSWVTLAQWCDEIHPDKILNHGSSRAIRIIAASSLSYPVHGVVGVENYDCSSRYDEPCDRPVFLSQFEYVRTNRSVGMSGILPMSGRGRGPGG